jgi:hypothetical protein
MNSSAPSGSERPGCVIWWNSMLTKGATRRLFTTSRCVQSESPKEGIAPDALVCFDERDLGLEGLIPKRRRSCYEPGRSGIS